MQRPSDPGTQTIDLRLHGVAASGAFRLSPAAIEVSVDGSPVDAQLVPAEIDLGNENQAWRVATFGLPSSAQTVTIRLTLGAEGTLETGGNTQSVDLRGAPIFFQAVPSQLRTQNKVDVNVDLTRSIVAQNGGAVLLPVLLVQY